MLSLATLSPLVVASQTSASALPTCKSAALHLTTSSNAGLGHGSLIVVVHNQGNSACRMSGYPRVVTSSLGPLTSMFSPVFRGTSSLRAVAKDTISGYAGGLNLPWHKPLPVVTLRAKTGVSSFVVEWIEISSKKTCRSFARLYVTPPGASGAIRLDSPGLLCSALYVHPVVTGTTGSLT